MKGLTGNKVWKRKKVLTHLEEIKWSCEKLQEKLHEKLHEKVTQKVAWKICTKKLHEAMYFEEINNDNHKSINKVG